MIRCILHFDMQTCNACHIYAVILCGAEPVSMLFTDCSSPHARSKCAASFASDCKQMLFTDTRLRSLSGHWYIHLIQSAIVVRENRSQPCCMHGASQPVQTTTLQVFSSLRCTSLEAHPKRLCICRLRHLLREYRQGNRCQC